MAMKVESSSMVEMTDATNQEKDQFTPSSTTKIIPKKLVQQIEAAWPTVKSALESSGISCILNVGAQSSMTISITRSYTGQLVKFSTATVLIILLSKGAPIDSAIKVLEVRKGGIRLELIRLSAELGGLCAQYRISKKVYSKRSKELVSESTLEELRRLAGCGLVFYRDGLIVATGSVQGLKLVSKIVKDCIVRGVPPLPRIRKLRNEKVIDDLAGLKF